MPWTSHESIFSISVHCRRWRFVPELFLGRVLWALWPSLGLGFLALATAWALTLAWKLPCNSSALRDCRTVLENERSDAWPLHGGFIPISVHCRLSGLVLDERMLGSLAVAEASSPFVNSSGGTIFYLMMDMLGPLLLGGAWSLAVAYEFHLKTSIPVGRKKCGIASDEGVLSLSKLTWPLAFEYRRTIVFHLSHWKIDEKITSFMSKE